MGIIIVEICKNGVSAKAINSFYDTVYTTQSCLYTIQESFNDVIDDLIKFFSGFKPGDFHYNFIYKCDFDIRYRLNREIN